MTHLEVDSAGRRFTPARACLRALAVVALLVPALAGWSAPAWALDPQIPLERYSLTRWDVDDGLPHSQVHDISQTPDGFLWVASWEGTSRFDGLEFHPVEALRQGDGLVPASHMLWPMRDGSMLVGQAQLGLRRVPPTGAARSACSEYPSLHAFRVREGIGGVNWIASRAGLVRMGGDGRCELLLTTAAVGDLLLQALLPRKDGSVWLGTRLGVYAWRDGVLRHMDQALGLPQGSVRELVEDADGEAVWVAGEHGVWQVRGQSARRMHAARAQSMLRDRTGAIWVMTSDAHLMRYWAGRWQVLASGHDVLGHSTGALFEDREGLIWFGTTHGLHRVSDGAIWRIGGRDGRASDYIRSIVQTADGQVWVGHTDGLSRVRPGAGALAPLFPQPGQAGSTVLSMARARDGGIWAGTYNLGVLHVSAGEPTRVQALTPPGSHLATDQVRALHEDTQGTLWIGTERGLYRWREGRLDTTLPPGLPALPVRVIQPDRQGRLWIGMVGGIAWIESDGQVVVPSHQAQFPGGTVFDVLDAGRGDVWIAHDRGLARYADGRFSGYGARHGLVGSSVFRLFADGFGNLWASGNHGVMRIPLQAFDEVDQGQRARLPVDLFERDDGMPSRQANGGSAPAGWQLDNGELWIPTPMGVAVLDPQRVVAEQQHDIPLVIDDLKVDGEAVPVVDGTRLAPGARVQVQFAGISLRHPHALRYRYRMHGYDKDWIDAGTQRRASYTNLPPGRLRLEVQVAHAPTDWSRPAASAVLELFSSPPWWSRPVSLLATAFGVLVLLVLSHGLLLRHQHRRQRHLEQLVAQRTQELSVKNRALEDASRQREQLLEKLAHQASHDPLTGMPNRRASDIALSAALRHADSRRGPLCVAIIDIDRFKHINDRYGHQAGDRVLQKVSTQLRAALQREDVFVGRSGGEEFVVVMRDMALPQALVLLEHARQAVARMQLMPREGDLACTISVGLVQRQGVEGSDALLQRADACLYEAKRQGRDRIVAA